MAICRMCSSDHSPEELVRHEHARLLFVHCPDCNCLMGSYRRHADAPAVDLLRESRT